jgi:hypothetical protein
MPAFNTGKMLVLQMQWACRSTPYFYYRILGWGLYRLSLQLYSARFVALSEKSDLRNY